MTRKPKPAILPRKASDPTGADALERQAMQAMRGKVAKARRIYADALGRIPSEPAVNRRYEFRLDAGLLSSVLAMAGQDVDSLFLDGGMENVWFFQGYGAVAYQRGTSQEFSNLAAQSPSYASGQESLQNILRSEPYRRRIALIAAREYEEMEGLSGNIKANMSRVLTDGIGRGRNPRDIAKDLTRQAGIESRRAERIARTEITTALRRARWDEHDEARQRYGLRSLLMHYSALSPTTRITHAQRHGRLYTSDQVRDWYAEDGNSINCKCSQLSVLVDENGEPLNPAVVQAAKRTEQVMRAKGRGPWTKEE